MQSVSLIGPLSEEALTNLAGMPAYQFVQAAEMPSSDYLVRESLSLATWA